MSLIPHPACPPGPIARLRVESDLREDHLWLRFIAEGRIEGVIWPAAAPAVRADDLWRHTCFEAFVRTADGYREFNLSPSGRWAAYRFAGYRTGMAPAAETAEVIGFRTRPGLVELEARIQTPPDQEALGFSAVIETDDKTLTYWALAHPSAKPDFHHPDSFVSDLP